MGKLTAITLFVALAGAALAQTNTEAPSFDVASVKPAAPLPPGVIMFRMGGGMGNVDPGRIDNTNITLRSLVASAYGVKDYQVEGPAWLDSERYDVKATIPKGADKDQVKLMMQRLLAERFQLALHRESKPMNVYTLSVAKGGSKLKEVDPATLPALPEPGSAPPPPPPPPGGGGRSGDFMKAGGPMPAGAMRMMMSPTGRHIMGNVNIEKLCDLLSNFLDRPVIDLTELKAMYELDLQWTPTESEKMGGKVGPKMAPPGAMAGGGGEPQHENDAASEPGPTLAEALLRTYGLKLEAKKDPADILVIDHANKVPTEN